LLQIEGQIIDNAMIFFALLFNICIIFVLLARAHEHYKFEDAIGILVNLLIIPFLVLWLLNLINGRDNARLITGFPIILFLLDDLLYRTIQKKKTKHKPKKWPLHLYIYFLLFLFGGMILTGYVFIVSLFYGFITLSLFYLSWISYGYYHYRHKKILKKQV
jgi:small-conductance mechanosensitive channel